MYALPGSSLFAASLVYGRMSGANEVVAIKSLGIHPIVILWPVFVFTFLLSLTSVWLNDVAVSWGYNNVQRVVIEAIDDIAYSMLRTQKTFNSKWFSISVRRVEDRRLIDTTLSFAARGNLPPVTIMAQEAEIHADTSRNTLVFSFRNARIQGAGGLKAELQDRFETEISLVDASGKPDTRSHPAHLPLANVPAELKKQAAQIEELEQQLATKAAYPLLVGDFDTATGKNWDADYFNLRQTRERLYRLKTESPRRWVNGFSCLFFVLVGAPMAIRLRNADYLTSFFIVFLPILLAYYPLLMFFVDRAKLGTLPPHSVWLCNVVFAIWGAWLLRRVIRF